MSVEYGVLNPDRTVRIVDVHEWLANFDNEDRIVARTSIAGLTISTVFLGINYGYFHYSEPKWFETMIFGDSTFEQDFRYQERTASYDQAMDEHYRAFAIVVTHHNNARFRHKLAGAPTPEELN